MINSIYIKNFKSIFEDSITLRPFTVLIGANGSGKSNLVKALEFLSKISSTGIAAAVYANGGFGGMMPKAISNKKLQEESIIFNYCKLLPVPVASYPNDLPQISVEHELQLAYSSQEAVRLTYEKFIFNEVLAVAEMTKQDYEEDKIAWDRIISPSSLGLERAEGEQVNLSVDPPLSTKTIPLYLQWLGFPFLERELKSKSMFNKFIQQIGSTKETRERSGESRKEARQPRSFLDPDGQAIIDYSAQAGIFRTLIQSIRRYDLLLNELRTEQPISESPQLSPTGLNMPSVLRHLDSDPDNEDAWNRIMTTLGPIAPHIENMKSKTLRTGKEFVEFVESVKGRGVESWESSDGTLRALAILLALETHRANSTILIEEPEQNLHPWAVRDIIDHIRDVVDKRGVQVVVTTHSEHVLERMYPEEVLVATRTQTEGTKFKTLEELLPDSVIEMGEIGQLWVKGLLGGVPSYD